MNPTAPAVAPHLAPLDRVEGVFQNVSAGDQGEVSVMVGQRDVRAPAGSYPEPLTCAGVDLNLPPGFAGNYSASAPNDASDPDAYFYNRLPNVALAIARKIVTAVQSMGANLTDVAGADHFDGAAQGIARALMAYVYDVPFAWVKERGWQKAMEELLSRPMFTWDANLPNFDFHATGGIKLAFPMQSRGDGLVSVHPAFVPFFFWNNAQGLSFYRFLRWHPTYGFVFTSAFAHKIAYALTAPFVSIQSGNPERFSNYLFPGNGGSEYDRASGAAQTYFDVTRPWVTEGMGGDPGAQYQVRTGPYPLDPLYDRMDWCDRPWIETSERMPASIVNQFRTMADRARDARRKSEVITGIALILAVFAIGGALSAISTAGASLSNVGQLVSAIDGIPGVDLQGAGKWIKVAGKFFNPGSLATSFGLTELAESGTEAAAEPIAADAAIDAAYGAANQGANAMEGWEVPTVEYPVFEADFPEVEVPDFQLGIWDNEMPSITTGIEDSPSVAEFPDAVADTSFMDTAFGLASQQAASGGGLLDGFDLNRFVGTLVNGYLQHEALKKQGALPSNSVARPTPGQMTRLPDGSTARTNSDGSTTITRPNGTQQTILPNGQVVGGGQQWVPGVPNIAVIAGGALAVMLALQAVRRR